MVHHGEAIERQQSICTITRERPMPNLSKLDFKKVGDPLDMPMEDDEGEAVCT